MAWLSRLAALSQAVATLVSEIPIRVHCLFVWGQVAFTLVGVNADPILNDFVVFRVLVSIVNVTQIMPTEIGVH